MHKPEEFSAVFSSRRVVRGELGAPFVLHYRLLDKNSLSRLGIVVPKRLVKTASLRNAIKRQGREAFRLMVNELPPCDLVLRLNRPLDDIRGRNHITRKGWRLLMNDLLKRIVSPSPA